MIKKIIGLAFLSCMMSNATNYNALITKEHNKYVNEAPLVAKATCKIELRDLKTSHYINIGNIQINTEAGAFDVGILESKIGTTTSNFTNMVVNVSSTYSNGSNYQPEYAQRGHEGVTPYWLAQGSPARYTMTLNESQMVTSIEYTDWARRDASSRDYFIDFYDCDGAIYNTVEIEGTLATEYNEVVTVNSN